MLLLLLDYCLWMYLLAATGHALLKLHDSKPQYCHKTCHDVLLGEVIHLQWLGDLVFISLLSLRPRKFNFKAC